MSQIAHLAILSTSLYFCTRDPSQLKRPSMQRDIIQYIDTVLITLQNRDSSILTEQTILCKTESEFFLRMLRFTACLKSGSDSSCFARKKQVLISNASLRSRNSAQSHRQGHRRCGMRAKHEWSLKQEIVIKMFAFRHTSAKMGKTMEWSGLCRGLIHEGGKNGRTHEQ